MENFTSSHPASLLDLHDEDVVCGTVEEVNPSLLVKRQSTALVGSLTKTGITLQCMKESSFFIILLEGHQTYSVYLATI